jgi:zinc/manganese transport system ATP-binding protein
LSVFGPKEGRQETRSKGAPVAILFPVGTVEPDRTVPGGPPAEAVLSFRDAGINLGGRWVLEHVSFEIGAGEFVAIIGPNGSGKSTLLKAALGLLPLSSGYVTFLGREARRGNRQIGYLPQRRSFDPDIRIRGVDVVRLGLDGDRWGFPLPRPAAWRSASARRDDDRIDEVIRQVGAEGFAQRPAGELSGGEQQRLLIAQALASNPKILLLDEPLDSLDQTNQQQVASLVSRICREDRVSVVLVTHDINPIIGHIDRVIYLAAGRAVAGPPDQVITTESLTRLYGVPVEVLRTSDGRQIVVGQPEPETVSYHSHGGG